MTDTDALRAEVARMQHPQMPEGVEHKVRELIEALQAVDPDLDVILQRGEVADNRRKFVNGGAIA